MQNYQEYLSKTETATRLLFQGVSAYREILKEAAAATTFATSYADFEDLERQHARWQQENAATIERAEQLYNRYFAESFSQATLCGSILQIASKAIEKYSANSEIPANVRAIVGSHLRLQRFCVGRELRGLPIGLVIYAGRNQHMHFESHALHPSSQNVFDHLATVQYGGGDTVKDPAFDPSNPSLESLAHNVVALLGWKAYEDFFRDVSEMLNQGRD